MKYKCYNCNDESELTEFCSHAIPTPWCRACRSCLCSENDSANDEKHTEKKIRYYSSIDDDHDLLNSITSRYALEQRLVKEKMQYGTAVPRDVYELRGMFTAPQVNELIRVLVQDDIGRSARKAAADGILPKREAFSGTDKSIFRRENVFPVRVLENGFSRPIVLLYGMAGALRSVKKLGLSPAPIYIGSISTEPPKFLAPFFAEERDYTGQLQAFEDWLRMVMPDRVYFYESGAVPQCRIGNNKRIRYVSESGHFPSVERIREYFSASSGFHCAFHDTPSGDTVMIPQLDKVASDFANTCDLFWKELLVTIGRSSGIILLQSDLKELAFVRQYLFDNLSEEGYEVSDFQNYKPGQSYYAGDIVVAHHLQLEEHLLPLLELARSVPVILFYTSAVHPSEYIDRESYRRLFNDYIVGHYLFTAVRYLCGCARGVTPQPVVLNSQVTLDLYEPKGCDQCFQTGYRQKSLVFIPYVDLVPNDSSASPVIDAVTFRTIFPSKTLDYYYATRLLGPEIKNQELLTRMLE